MNPAKRFGGQYTIKLEYGISTAGRVVSNCSHPQSATFLSRLWTPREVIPLRVGDWKYMVLRDASELTISNIIHDGRPNSMLRREVTVVIE